MIGSLARKVRVDQLLSPDGVCVGGGCARKGLSVEEGKEEESMSQDDELFCARVARVTKEKALSTGRKEEIRTLVKGMTVGTVKGAGVRKKK
ncbi:MAG TPA: hypothetical protein VM008_04960 [Phycisphaerae bacterium]|nr:hypothetical protein [Phycisphaerae bacterium]